MWRPRSCWRMRRAAQAADPTPASAVLASLRIWRPSWRKLTGRDGTDGRPLAASRPRGRCTVGYSARGRRGEEHMGWSGRWVVLLLVAGVMLGLSLPRL